MLAEDERFHVAARGSITVADGEPANDIPGYGVFARLQVAPGWRVGLALDASEYDFEEPAKVIGIVQDPSLEPIDALAEANTLGAWLERSIERGRMDWFFGAGVGAASVDVPDVAGARGDGGSFDIHTEVDTEIIVSAIGYDRRLSRLRRVSRCRGTLVAARNIKDSARRSGYYFIRCAPPTCCTC